MAIAQHPAVPSPPASVPEARDAQAARTLVLFSFMWAAFTFFHQAKWTYWTRTPIESLQTAAAIAVLFRPSSLGAFLALVLLQMADLMDTMPNISNHSIFAMFVNMTIVITVVIEMLRRRGSPLDGGRLYRLFAPAVRLEVIALYFWVVVHKLNFDFFSPESSCAVNHYQHLSALLQRGIGLSLPDQAVILTLTVWLTLVIEAAIPILLLRSKTRVAGVMLGLVFHFVLGVNVFHDFSGMIFALYLLFLPANFTDEAVAWFRSVVDKTGAYGRRGAALVQSVPLPAWAALGVAALLLAAGNSWRLLEPIFFRLWLVYGATCILAFAAIVYARRSNFTYESRAFRTHPALLLFPLVVLVNGLSPYLGLKTENSFSMFSNLRTEGGQSNHLFIPASWQIFDFQKDMVTVTASSDSYLNASTGASMPFVLFVEHIRKLRQSGVKNIEVSYRRGGAEHHVLNAESHPELAKSYPWYVRKLQRFRRIDNQPRQLCRH